MRRTEPPFWLEGILHLVVPKRHREAVSGDLYEEFRDEKMQRLGTMRASFWYFRQILSFLPQRLSPLLASLCWFTLLSGVWLGLMDLRLRHPGYAGRELIAALIVGQAALTLVTLRPGPQHWLRPVVFVGCVGILLLALRALAGVVSGANFEGYVLLIALALVLQSALTVVVLAGLNKPVVRGA